MSSADVKLSFGARVRVSTTYDHHFIIPGRIDEQATLEQAQAKSSNDTRTHVVHYHRGEEECFTNRPHRVYVNGQEDKGVSTGLMALPVEYRSMMVPPSVPMTT